MAASDYPAAPEGREQRRPHPVGIRQLLQVVAQAIANPPQAAERVVIELLVVAKMIC
jgi:hypothetical protein